MVNHIVLSVNNYSKSTLFLLLCISKQRFNKSLFDKSDSMKSECIIITFAHALNRSIFRSQGIIFVFFFNFHSLCCTENSSPN